MAVNAFADVSKKGHKRNNTDLGSVTLPDINKKQGSLTTKAANTVNKISFQTNRESNGDEIEKREDKKKLK